MEAVWIVSAIWRGREDDMLRYLLLGLELWLFEA